MKLLITGADGQLGRELIRLGRSAHFEIHSFNHQQLDITDEDRIRKILTQTSPGVVVNAAAYTDVDKAESEAHRAYAVNESGPRYLARQCLNQRKPMIHISTDYVFDGSKGRPYLESDPIAPLGAYGQSKAQGEAAIRSILKSHIIIRTSWLYGVHGNNFVKTMLKLGAKKSSISVVSDQFGSPTCAADLAEAVLSIAEKIIADEKTNWGTYHYCGQGITTWHSLAEKVFQLAAPYMALQTKQIEAITTADWPTPVKRPPYSVLDCTLIKNKFGIDSKPWQKSLAQTIDRIFS